MVYLLLGADDAYAMPMAIAAHSALTHLSRHVPVEVHVLDDGISEANRERAARVLHQAHPKVKVRWRTADLRAFEGINVRRYSAASMIRLLLPDLFPETVERVLYIDSDLIVNDDIHQLWETDLGDHAIWAVQNGPDDEFDRFIRSKFPEVQAPKEARYFNSGVLLVNLPKWRAQRISERTVAFLHRHSDALSFPDQDALNATLAGNWGRLPARWNKQIIRIGQPECAPLKARGILHYTSHKPWRPAYPWKGKSYFHLAYLRSGWERSPRAHITTLRLYGSQILQHNLARIRRRIKSYG